MIDGEEEETLELTEELEEEIPSEDVPASEEESGDKDDESLTIQIGDDEPEEAEEAPEWVKELRRANREKDRRIRELEARDKPESKLPEKPTLEGCDYDNAEFERKLEEWYEAKREHDTAEAEQRSLAEKQEQRWQQKLSRYDQGKVELGAKDYDDVESVVMDILDEPFPGINAPDVRINIIKQGAKDPNTIIYALGRNPKKAAELAKIDDPVEFAFALGEMSAKMKVTKGKPPPPEKKLTGAGTGGASDNHLDRLREEAARTGDYTKVMAYKRSKKG